MVRRGGVQVFSFDPNMRIAYFSAYQPGQVVLKNMEGFCPGGIYLEGIPVENIMTSQNDLKMNWIHVKYVSFFA